MPSKSDLLSFTQNWTKTVNWAKQNNIPYNVYYPVYQQEVQKFVSGGTQYSEAARIHAIEAAAGLNYSNALPTDNHSPTDILGNIKSNLEQIFTPSTPYNIVSSIFDTITNTLHHPSTIYSPVEARFSGPITPENVLFGNKAEWDQIRGKDNIWNFVPGIADAATLMQTGRPSMKGWDQLAEQPLTTALDIVPLGRGVSEGLGRTAIGESAAARLGMPIGEFRKAGIWRIGGRLIKSVPVQAGKGTAITSFLDPETGSLASTGFEPHTIGSLWEHYKGKMGANYEQAEINKESIMASQEGSRTFERLLAPEMDRLRKLTPEQYDQLTTLTQEARIPSDVEHDETIPRTVRDAYAAVDRVTNTYNQMIVQTGELLHVTHPIQYTDENGELKTSFITEDYLGTSPQYHALDRAQRASEDYQRRLNDAVRPVRKLMYDMGQADNKMFGGFVVLDQYRNVVWQSISQYLADQGADTAIDDNLRKTLPTYRRRPTRAEIEQTPLLRNLLGLPPTFNKAAERLFPEMTPTLQLGIRHVTALRDLFAPGGLIDQMVQAFQKQDWIQLNKVSRMVIRKFNGKAFEHIPKDGRALLFRIRQVSTELQRYAAQRQSDTERLQKLMLGRYRGQKMNKAGYQKSIAYLSKQTVTAHQHWIKVAIQNPPDIWRNIKMDIVSNKLAQAEKTAAAIDGTTKKFSEQGWSDSAVTKVRQDERTVLELMSSSAKMSMANDILPDIDLEEYKMVEQSAYDEMASLRARGEKPMALSALSEQDVKTIRPSYEVHVAGIRPRRPGVTFSKVMGYTPSIYDVRLALLKTGKELIERDITNEFVEHSLKPRLYHGPDIERLAVNYFHEEIGNIAAEIFGGAPRTEAGIGVIERFLEDKFNLVRYNHELVGFGSDFSHPSLGSEYYIDKDIAKGFNRSMKQFQLGGLARVVDRGTQIFRFSILGLSPRYTAHILLGGTYLLVLRGHFSMLRPQIWWPAIQYALHGSFDDKTLARFPWAEAIGYGAGTEEGLATINYHYVAGRSFGRHALIPAWLAKHGIADTPLGRLTAIGELNTMFTRAIVRMQQAIVYLDAADRAERSGKMVTVEKPTPRLNAKGEHETHNITGRGLYDMVKDEHPITAQEAHQEAMHTLASVMGELRHMTPLEYGTLQKLFPFYSWTKHIIKYVMSYPFDHPYRAMILSQMAKQENQYWNSGLPIRMQLLLFLGHPDQFGNITAIDTKSTNPLRDVANYATLTGIFESLNPALIALPAMVDPQIQFGGQSLFPQETYNSLYGVETAGPGGNVWTAAEQFVPQLTAADAAYNLSGQYAYLRNAQPNAFYKKVVESLGLPLMPEQLNLRQIAAQGELDRFNQSKHDAESFVKGDPTALQGYAPNQPIPDPFNALYNVTPAYLQALQQQSEDQYNLPAWDTQVAPPNPPL